MSRLLGDRADAWFVGLSMEVLVELSTQIVTHKNKGIVRPRRLMGYRP